MTIPEIRPFRPDSDTTLPPNNPEAELALLGSVLLDRTVVTRVSPFLDPRDFWTIRHAVIYAAMVDLDRRGEPVDYLTLVTELERTGRLAEAGTATFVGGLLGAVPTPIHAEEYARIVARCGLMRRLVSAGGKIATLGYQNAEDPETALERCEAILAEVASSAPVSDFVPILDGLRAYVDRLAARAEADPLASPTADRLPTTYRDLDRLLGGGLSRGDLVLLAGRPGMGKSALALEIVARVALAYRVRIALFSLEMGVGQVLNRMISTTSGVPLTTLDQARLSKSQVEALGSALGQLAEVEVLVDESGTQTIDGIRSKVRRLASGPGVDLVVVDHIQLVSARAENRVAELGEISRGLKALAREQHVAVLALSQLSRAVEQRADKVPILADLRESGTLEQDADVVAMLFREEYYKPETERLGVADVLVLKNRNGQTGKLGLIWNPETTGFRGLEAYDG